MPPWCPLPNLSQTRGARREERALRDGQRPGRGLGQVQPVQRPLHSQDTLPLGAHRRLQARCHPTRPAGACWKPAGRCVRRPASPRPPRPDPTRPCPPAASGLTRVRKKTRSDAPQRPPIYWQQSPGRRRLAARCRRPRPLSRLQAHCLPGVRQRWSQLPSQLRPRRSQRLDSSRQPGLLGPGACQLLAHRRALCGWPGGRTWL